MIKQPYFFTLKAKKTTVDNLMVPLYNVNPNYVHVKCTFPSL